MSRSVRRAVRTRTRRVDPAGRTRCLAPPALPYREDGRAVPIDIQHVDVAIEFDGRNGTAVAAATVRFRALADGYPLFDLVPAIEACAIDGEHATVGTVAVRQGGAEVTRMRALHRRLRCGSLHELALRYSLSDSLRYLDRGSGRVGFGFFMSDLGDAGRAGRSFLERYVPANLEYDQFSLRVELVVRNSRFPHLLFTTGRLRWQRSRADNDGWHDRWQVEFPDHTTCSSPFLHLFAAAPERPFCRQREWLRADRRTVPVEVYSRDADAAALAIDRLCRFFPDLERRFGPYPHAALIAYVTADPVSPVPGADAASGAPGPGPRGMEYCGAMMVDADDRRLRHELAHCWFGRGVLPASGGDGWLDEAIVLWLLREPDPGEYRLPGRGRMPLSVRSPYHRTTSKAIYGRGASVMRHVDWMLRRAGRRLGLTVALHRFFNRFRLLPSSTVDFTQLVRDEFGVDLEDTFDELVYAGRRTAATPPNAVDVEDGCAAPRVEAPAPIVPGLRRYRPDEIVEYLLVDGSHAGER